MPLVVKLETLRTSPTAMLFEGGEVAASMFVTDTPPGLGPDLHVHPYAEVFLVQEGTATFTVAEEELEVSGGHVVVVPPETPHGFKNRSDSPLRIVSVHPNGKVIQTWLED